jgi:hypothetical protein
VVASTQILPCEQFRTGSVNAGKDGQLRVGVSMRIVGDG